MPLAWIYFFEYVVDMRKNTDKCSLVADYLLALVTCLAVADARDI